jgi:WD40 repeat protein
MKDRKFLFSRQVANIRDQTIPSFLPHRNRFRCYTRSASLTNKQERCAGRSHMNTSTQVALLVVGPFLISSLLLAADVAVNPGASLVIQTGHADTLYKVLLSDSGTLAASGGLNGWISIWNLPKGIEIRRFHAPEGQAPFAFTSDEHRLVIPAGADLDLLGIDDGSRITRNTGFEGVTGVAISPDGRWIACSDAYGNVSLVASAAGRSPFRIIFRRHEAMTVLNMAEQINHIKTSGYGITGMVFNATSRLLAVTTQGGTLLIFAVSSGHLIRQSDVQDARIESLAFDQRDHLLIGLLQTKQLDNMFPTDARLQILDTTSGRLLFDRPAPKRGSAILNSHGTAAAVLLRTEETWSSSRTDLHLYRLPTMIEITLSREWSAYNFEDPASLGNGTLQLLLRESAGSQRLRLLTVDSGSNRLLDSSPVRDINKVSFVDGQPTIFSDLWVSRWNLEAGTPMYSAAPIGVPSFSPDGKWVAQQEGDGSLSLTGSSAGASRSRLPLTERLADVKVANGGGTLLLSTDGGFGGVASYWRVGDQRTTELCTSETMFGSHTKTVIGTTGKYVAAVCNRGFDSRVVIVDVSRGAVVREIHKTGVAGIALSTDEHTLAMTSPGTLSLISIADDASDREIAVLPSSGKLVALTEVSLDVGGLVALVGSWNIGESRYFVEFIDLVSEKVLVTLEVSSNVKSIATSSSYALVASSEGIVNLLDIKSMASIATLFDAGPDAWLTITSDGWFDGTADAMRWVGWRVRNTSEINSLDAFFTDYYRPGLFAELMSGARLQAQVDLATLVQVPSLRIMLSQKQVHLEDRAGMVIVCFEQIPGVESAANVIATERRPLPKVINGYKIDPTDPTCKYQKALANSEHDAPDMIKRLEAWTPERLDTPWDGRSSDTKQSVLHVLTVGVSSYVENRSGFGPVPYAAPSARAIERFFRNQQSLDNKPFASVKVWDGLYDESATRDQVRKTLAEMAKHVSDDDVVLMYLAGHGKVSAGQEMFYFVPADGKDTDAQGRELQETGVSTAMLAEALRNLPARRIVLFLDTCQAGGAVEALSKIGLVKTQVEERRGRLEGAVANHEHGVGIHLVAATMPLSYAVGIGENQSALAATVLAGFQQSGDGTITAQQIVGYVSDKLPDAVEKATHFRQVPLVQNIGLDFPLVQK